MLKFLSQEQPPDCARMRTQARWQLLPLASQTYATGAKHHVDGSLDAARQIVDTLRSPPVVPPELYCVSMPPQDTYDEPFQQRPC